MQTPCSRCGGTLGAAGHGLCAACLLRLATMPEALAPEYEIETLLGSGRTGTTYLARAIGTGDMLAVKIVNMQDGADAHAIAGRLAADLLAFRHPHVAATHAVDVDADGNLRIVRDYVMGRSLPAWAGKAGAAERRRTFERLAAAVAEVHARGLAHGHLDAPNVIITSDAQPVIVDFGAASALRQLRGAGTEPGEMAGADLTALEALRTFLTDPA